MAALSGCGGSNHKTTPTPTPTPTPSAPAISSLSPSSGAVGATVTIAGSNFGASQGSSTVTFNGTAASASSWSAASITVAVPNGATTGNVVVTVGGLASNGAAFTVTPPPVATITVSPASPSIAVGATQQFTATAKDSNGNTISGVTFTWASSTTSVATIDGNGLATGVSAGMTQITASAQNITSSADTLTVTSPSACTSGGSESLLTGSYAFLLKGFDSSGNPALVIGAFSFDGAGTITAGSMDENLSSGVGANIAVTSGCYEIGSDQRGSMMITTANATQNYRFSVGNISAGVASTGHMIDFDSAGPFTTGILRKQSGGPFSNASANGSYAFGGGSLQNAAVCASPCKFGIAGVVSFDGKGGVSGGSEDFNQNGTVDGNAANTTWPASPVSIDSGGTYSVSANGRTTLKLSFGGGSSSANTVLYIVSSDAAFFMSADPQTSSTLSAGTVLLQSGAPFAANPLSGTYVGYDSGTGTGAGRTDLFLLGPMTAGNNAITGVEFRNTGGNFGSGGLSGSTYTVSSTGRTIVSGGGGHAPLLYLVSTSQAFFLQSNLSVDSGFFKLQSAGPFSNSSVSGTFSIGYIDPELPAVGAVSGVAIATPASNSLSITLDGNVSGGPVTGQAQNATYSIDNTGLGLEPLGCSVTVTPITCDTAFYVISPGRVVSMDLHNTNPVIVTADQ